MAITLEPALIQRLVAEALEEDRADDDATTAALITPGQHGRGIFIAKAPGVIAGLAFAEDAFRQMDPDCDWSPTTIDGDQVAPGLIIATVEGPLGALLRAERTALDFLTHLSGVATATADIVRLLEGTGCRLRDTRKTIPGLRLPEKYAAQVGGAETFRTDLAAAVMVKDNHIAALRARELDIPDAVRLAREAYPELRIEVEVTTLNEAVLAASAGADEVLLDNMSAEEVRNVVETVTVRTPRLPLEASGGITAENVREMAETGVDYVSMGAITHSAATLDISLKIEGV
ncbi:MAG: carboxylating nicotinate-nucleotide diphosphorylase [Dehalococcoidia bacterium]